MSTLSSPLPLKHFGPIGLAPMRSTCQPHSLQHAQPSPRDRDLDQQGYDACKDHDPQKEGSATAADDLGGCLVCLVYHRLRLERGPDVSPPLFRAKDNKCRKGKPRRPQTQARHETRLAGDIHEPLPDQIPQLTQRIHCAAFPPAQRDPVGRGLAFLAGVCYNRTHVLYLHLIGGAQWLTLSNSWPT